MVNAVAFVLAATLLSAAGLTLPNLALNKPTHQSSTCEGRPSDRAVDGNNDTRDASGTCSVTAAVPEPSIDWWQVDLQTTFNVISVSVTSRGDCCPGGLTNFTVVVHASDPTTSNNSGLQLCYWHEDSVGIGLTVDLTCAENVLGRYVRIVKYNSGYNPLTLCEVVIRGTSLRDTCSESSAAFRRQTTGAREPDYIISSHENLKKLDCAIMCLRMASCNAFNFRAPSAGMVNCELLAVNLKPVSDAPWDIYEISVSCA